MLDVIRQHAGLPIPPQILGDDLFFVGKPMAFNDMLHQFTLGHAHDTGARLECVHKTSLEKK